jgi:Zn-dependent M28 family amino/carboxypeptidase
MTKRFLLVLTLAVWACDGGLSPEPTEFLSETAFLEHLSFLADDSLYGRGSGSPYEREAAEYIRDRFSEYGLTPGVPGFLQDFSAEVRRDSSTLTSQNVLGVLPGTGDLAGQWVVLGAHYDHLGYDVVSQDSLDIYNGADDNASGTSLLLETARYLSHYFAQGSGGGRDRRSIMFQAYGAEEPGLLGSSHFVEYPTVPMDSVVAMVNLDMVGRMQNNVLIVLGATTAPRWDDVLDAANEAALQFEYGNAGLGRSDQYPFLVQGTPVLYFTTGLHDEYHTPEDDVWRLNQAGMVLLGDLVARVVSELAVRAEPLRQ